MNYYIYKSPNNIVNISQFQYIDHLCKNELFFYCTNQPNPVLMPGESHGQKSLTGYGPCDFRESDTTEAT